MTDFIHTRWENLVMANYSIDPARLFSYVPPGVELDLYEGKAMVSLVGFIFKGTKIFKIPIPYLGTFEEVNLRFYVKRSLPTEIKRGVVFINETVPYKAVAWVANKLYNERYTAIPTKHHFTEDGSHKKMEYQWYIKNKWNRLGVTIVKGEESMMAGSMEEFIFEHYYGYTRINASTSQEYRVDHPRWTTNKVIEYDVHCDFDHMYGPDFAFLNHQNPDSVLFAAGSGVTIKWKRETFSQLIQ